MKLLLAIILSMPVVASAQWRPVKVSSGTDIQSIQENFRRASIYSNRKLDKFSNDTIYGAVVFKSSITLSDGGVLTSTSPFAQLASTQTFTGINTLQGKTNVLGNATFTSSTTITADALFSGTASTTTFAGWVDIGHEIISNACGVVTSCTATCSAGKKVLGGGCYLDGSAPLSYAYPNSATTFTCAKSAGGPSVTAYAICARVK